MYSMELSEVKIGKVMKEVAEKDLAVNGLENFVKVAVASYAQDFTVEIESEEITRTIRIDLTTCDPLRTDNAAELARRYRIRLETKAEIEAGKVKEKVVK